MFKKWKNGDIETGIENENGDSVCTMENNQLHHLPVLLASQDLASACESVLAQVVSGKVLERDACITQMRRAMIKAGRL